jgi:hypothetical protein
MFYVLLLYKFFVFYVKLFPFYVKLFHFYYIYLAVQRSSFFAKAKNVRVEDPYKLATQAYKTCRSGFASKAWPNSVRLFAKQKQ